MTKSRILFLLVLFVAGCSSADKKLYLDKGNQKSVIRCGTESYVNRYASYRCASLELENNNDYVNKDTPIHNIKAVIMNREQRLLVVAEKIFNAKLRESDQEIVCTRRLKVILNPGTGPGQFYQEGWLTYRPSCLKFFNLGSLSQINEPQKYFSKLGTK